MSELTSEGLQRLVASDQKDREEKRKKRRGNWRREGKVEIGEITAAEQKFPTGGSNRPPRGTPHFSTVGSATHRMSRGQRQVEEQK